MKYPFGADKFFRLSLSKFNKKNISLTLPCINIHSLIMYLIQDAISFLINADPDPQYRTAVFFILKKKLNAS